MKTTEHLQVNGGKKKTGRPVENCSYMALKHFENRKTATKMLTAGVIRKSNVPVQSTIVRVLVSDS